MEVYETCKYRKLLLITDLVFSNNPKAYFESPQNSVCKLVDGLQSDVINAPRYENSPEMLPPAVQKHRRHCLGRAVLSSCQHTHCLWDLAASDEN